MTRSHNPYLGGWFCQSRAARRGTPSSVVTSRSGCCVVLVLARLSLFRTVETNDSGGVGESGSQTCAQSSQGALSQHMWSIVPLAELSSCKRVWLRPARRAITVSNTGSHRGTQHEQGVLWPNRRASSRAAPVLEGSPAALARRSTRTAHIVSPLRSACAALHRSAPPACQAVSARKSPLSHIATLLRNRPAKLCFVSE